MRTVAALLLLLDSALASWDTDNATMDQAEYEGDNDKIEMLSLYYFCPATKCWSIPSTTNLENHKATIHNKT